MYLIIGIVVVFLCVIGGFLMINGPLGVLIQPSEFVVIGGAVIGATIAANPLKLLLLIVAKLPVALKGSPYTKNAYAELLQVQYDIYVNSKKNGILSIEEDVNEPHSSTIFTDRKSTRLNSSHLKLSRMPSSA